jgi:hypothetical protein
MYPSGSWRGFWDQPVYGRQTMRELVLRFSAGRVDGRGVDIVGPFTFDGTHESDGTVKLMKRYPYHSVTYQGRYDGEGTVYGEWSIGVHSRGKFVLTPNRSRNSEGSEILEITRRSYKSSY